MNIKICPHCDTEIQEGDDIFYQAGYLIGCENCIESTYYTPPTESEDELSALEDIWDDERWGLI